MKNLTITLWCEDRNGRLKEFEGILDDSRPVAECKKGREIVDQSGKQSVNDAKKASGFADQNEQFRTQAHQQGDQLANELTPATSGALSPYAKAQYNQAVRNNASGADNMRQQGFATISRRGFGSAPIGAGSSIVNSANAAENLADTGAYTNAMDATHGDLLNALNYRTQEQQMYDPAHELEAATSANNAATQAGVARSKMGSTFGDIVNGAKGIAGIAAGFMNPASTLTKGLGSFAKS